MGAGEGPVAQPPHPCAKHSPLFRRMTCDMKCRTAPAHPPAACVCQHIALIVRYMSRCDDTALGRHSVRTVIRIILIIRGGGCMPPVQAHTNVPKEYTSKQHTPHTCFTLCFTYTREQKSLYGCPFVPTGILIQL
jgi:hypothetical protein